MFIMATSLKQKESCTKKHMIMLKYFFLDKT